MTYKEVNEFLDGKEIELEHDEYNDFNLGNYSKQKCENSVELEIGTIFYIVNEEDSKCYIAVYEMKENDENYNDIYTDGYYSTRTLDELLGLIEKSKEKEEDYGMEM